MNYTYYKRYRPSQRRSSFKSFFWLVVILVLFFLLLRACVSMISSISEEKKDEAVLSVYRGGAEILEWGQTEPIFASDTELVLEGDQVSTQADSLVTLTFYEGSMLYLDENTKLSFVDFSETEEGLALTIELLDGRVWVSQTAGFEFLIRTDVMNLSSLQADYMVSNIVNAELLAVKNGQVNADLVDRGMEDIVVETATIKENDQMIFDDTKERALLNRENVTLVETVPAERWTDAFVAWATGSSIPGDEVEEESSVEEETPEAPETVVEEISDDLVIRIVSPTSGSTITKDAIALEGEVVSGTASTITVTWSGSGLPYTLSSYTAGSSTFRYVADTDYSNYALGQNTYTIVAYDEEGNPSNTVIITLNAEF